MPTSTRLSKPCNDPRSLALFSAGMMASRTVRRVLALAGWQAGIGPLMRRADAVGVWGRKPSGLRAMRAAARRGWPVLSLEDAFLRSPLPGRGAAPLGLMLDERGVYLDAAAPSTLEHILLTDPLDDAITLARAQSGRRFLIDNGLSKYSPVPRGHGAETLPSPGFVLLVDQAAGDASIRHGGAGPHTFRAMLAAARAEHPGRQLVIRAHPAGRAGCFGSEDIARAGDVRVLDQPANPWDLLERAHAVYTVTSQLGFEAILAGHRPQVFGLPFYAGWGLSDDRQHCPRRGRALSVDQLFAGAMLRAPLWYDPFEDALCDFERACTILLAQARAHWLAARPVVATGMARWKRPVIRQFLGRGTRFADPPARALAQAAALGAPLVIWSSREGAELAPDCAAQGVPLWRVEDGFLRSAGLGARLVPAQSLVLDNSGIYYDPASPSRLEHLIASAASQPAHPRASALRAAILAAGATKYNLPGGAARLPDIAALAGGRLRLLVPGQVADDASVRRGAGAVADNRALILAARADFPGAYLIYKPHPDVEAGLRPGHVPDAGALADLVLHDTPANALLAQVDAVATMTSLLGFEALLRERRVICYGRPFYAGWGLTEDRGAPLPRRAGALAGPVTLDALVQATLIDYPQYRDPITGRPCPPEVLVGRLSGARMPGPPLRLRLIARLQGLLPGRRQ